MADPRRAQETRTEQAPNQKADRGPNHIDRANEGPQQSTFVKADRAQSSSNGLQASQTQIDNGGQSIPAPPATRKLRFDKAVGVQRTRSDTREYQPRPKLRRSYPWKHSVPRAYEPSEWE